MFFLWPYFFPFHLVKWWFHDLNGQINKMRRKKAHILSKNQRQEKRQWNLWMLSLVWMWSKWSSTGKKIIWMRGKSTRHCLVINTRIIHTEEIKWSISRELEAQRRFKYIAYVIVVNRLHLHWSPSSSSSSSSSPPPIEGEKFIHWSSHHHSVIYRLVIIVSYCSSSLLLSF